MILPTPDPAVIASFRESLARDAETSDDLGWELVGGPYCGSVFPYAAPPPDGSLWIPVRQNLDLFAVYRISEGGPRRADFDTLHWLGQAAPPNPRPSEVCRPSIPAATSSTLSFRDAVRLSVSTLLGAMAACCCVWMTWLDPAARPVPDGRNATAVGD